MKYVLFEDQYNKQLYPLAYFRPVWELRCGALKLEDKIKKILGCECWYLARNYLMKYYLSSQKSFTTLSADIDIIMINGRWLLRPEDTDVLNKLSSGTALTSGTDVLAFRTTKAEITNFLNKDVVDSQKIFNKFKNIEHKAKVVHYLWDAIMWNPEEIEFDYPLSGNDGKISINIADNVFLLNQKNISIGPGCKIQPGVVIDAENGPVWIDDNVTIMANTLLEGPLYIGKNSTIKAGAKIYRNTTIGPVCKIGGEVEGCIIQGYSNKQHDGFLGHAYLGKWVNLGADTNNSDLKNNYGYIQVFVNGKSVNTGQRFVGLMMGDHSKCAINTMFNTGTIIGVCSNIFGAGMPPKFVPSFSWGGNEKLTEYNFDKALQVAKIVAARRKKDFTENDVKLFNAVRQLAKQCETGSHLS